MKWIDRWIGDLCLWLFIPFRRKPSKLPDSIKRILIIKFVAMGDLINLSPMVESLKRQHPRTDIDILIAPRVKEVVEAQGLFDHIYTLDFGLSFINSFVNIIKQLRLQKYDLCIDAEFYYRIATIISHVSGVRHVVGFNLQKTRSIFNDQSVVYNEKTHVAEAFQALSSAAGAATQVRELQPFQVNEQDVAYIASMMKTIKHPRIIVHPGTSERARSRRWPQKNWQQLMDQLSSRYHVILVGSKSERALIESLGKNDKITSMIDELTLPQLQELIAQADMYIGLDTGPTHIAAMTDTPIIALYGPNTPVRWGPYSKHAHILYANMKCSPCSRQHEGVISTCSDNKCMQSINVEDVAKKVADVLS